LNNKQLEYCNLIIVISISFFGQHHSYRLTNVKIAKFFLSYAMGLDHPFREEGLGQDLIECPIYFILKPGNYQLLSKLR
jgi:hypothetical protein